MQYRHHHLAVVMLKHFLQMLLREVYAVSVSSTFRALSAHFQRTFSASFPPHGSKCCAHSGASGRPFMLAQDQRSEELLAHTRALRDRCWPARLTS
jgi:hypothetical protein